MGLRLVNQSFGYPIFIVYRISGVVITTQHTYDLKTATKKKEEISSTPFFKNNFVVH
jgi:hypothetical protein